MEKVIRLSADEVTRLMERLSYADMMGRSVRFCIEDSPQGRWIKYDIGDGWTPPIYGLEW